MNLFFKYLFAFFFILTVFSCQEKYSKHEIPTGIGQVNSIEEISDFFNIDAALDKYPESLDLKIQKLKILQQRNWIDDSENFIETLLNEEFNLQVYELIVEYYLSQNDIKKAFEITDKVESQGLNNASFYDLKSMLYNFVGEYSKSIDYINKAILLNRSNYQYYYTKGQIYLSLNDTVSAIKFMNESLKLFENNFEVIYEISDLYVRSKQYQKADQLIGEAIKIAPQMEKLRITQAEIQIGQNNISLAISILKKSYTDNNDNYKSALRLSDIYMSSFYYDSVIFISDKILSIDSINIFALHNKALSYDKKGFYSSSISNYQIILAQDSLFENAKEEWQNVKAKRAYLQRLKDRKAAMPVFDIIVPKKTRQ